MTTFAVPVRPPLPSREGTRLQQPRDGSSDPPKTTLPHATREERWPAQTALSRSAPRQRILAQLVLTPGLHLRALRRCLDIELSTLEHHLRVLGRQGHTASHSFGRYKAFYPSADVDRRDWEMLFFLGQEQPGRILRLLADDFSADHTGIAAALGIAPGTCYFHLQKLDRAGILEREHDGPHILWSLREPGHVADLIDRYAPHPALGASTGRWTGGRPFTPTHIHGSGHLPPPRAIAEAGPGSA